MRLKDVGVEPTAPHPVCLCHTRTQRQPGLSPTPHGAPSVPPQATHRRTANPAYGLYDHTHDELDQIKPTASLLATLYMLYIMYKTHTHLHTSADASLHQDITPPPSMVC